MTPKQSRPQAEWDARLARGECTLEDALMMTLHAGVPASGSLIARLEIAFTDQREGRRHLAESFGSARFGNEAQTINAEVFARQVFALVDELHRQQPKGHPEHLPLSRRGDRTRMAGHTAYSKAAEVLALSEGTVIKHYSRGKSLHDRGKG